MFTIWIHSKQSYSKKQDAQKKPLIFSTASIKHSCLTQYFEGSDKESESFLRQVD